MEKRLICARSVKARIVAAVCIFVHLYVWLRIMAMPFGPTEKEAYFRVTIAVFLPLILSIAALFLKKPWLMYVAFVCAIPFGLYLLGQNGAWQPFGFFHPLYLLAAVLMTFGKAKTKRIR